MSLSQSQSSYTPHGADRPINNDQPSTTSEDKASGSFGPSGPPPTTQPPSLPVRNPERRNWLGESPSPTPRPSVRSLRRPFSPYKSKSVAELSPTTAFSKSLSLPAHRDSPRQSSPFRASLERVKRKGKAVDAQQVQHIYVSLPKQLDYPLAKHTIEQLTDVQYQVQSVLEKNDWAIRIVKAEGEAAAEEAAVAKTEAEPQGSPERPDSPETVTRPRTDNSKGSLNSNAPPLLLRKSVSYRELPTLEDDPAELVDDPLDEGFKLYEYSSSGSTSSSTSSSSTSLSRAHSCPRIRKGEDIRDFEKRISGDAPQSHQASPTNQASSNNPSTDGASDAPTQSFGGKMNNFNNFDAGNLNPNLARQAPQQPQAQQMNGLNGVTQWPNVGAQSDMNVLWEYIVKLSEMHEQIRAQTQQVTSGMQQIDSMRSSNGGTSSSPAVAHANGVINGLPPSSSESAEIARLQHELLSAHSNIEDLTSTITTLQNLNTDYENAISHTLDKLRPFTQSHAQALLAQKAHYLSLLEQERNQNLELRLEQSQWQEKAKEVKDMMVESLRLQSESEVGYVKKIAALKADNRSLRRICGVQLLEDSDDDEAAEAVERAQARDSVRQSPEQGRADTEVAVLDEKRITIN